MRRSLLVLLVPILLGPVLSRADEPSPKLSEKAKRERLLEIYRGEAAGYAIYRDSRRREKVELQREPVYVWTNPVRGGAQDGAVFVWTCRGRAEVVGTFFSYPATGARNLNHELHSLATTVLDVTREGAHTWSPKAPGIEPRPIPEAPEPASSASQRLAQMRALLRDFSATTRDTEGKRWELRPLPRPLFRYESTDPDVLDGSVFALVTSAGTDPEVLIVIEARRPPGGGPFAWQYGIARFTDMNVRVRLKGNEVFAGELIPWDAPEQDPQQRYRAFRDRGIPAVEEPAGAAEP